MSSDDRGPLVLTPDMIHERVRLVEVADLSHWDGPYQGDVGAAHTFMGTFGQFQLPVVVDGEVIYGQEFVAAEQTGEQFGGRVAVLDVTDLDWPREKVLAAVLGLDRLHALAQVDAAQLLDQLQEIQKADEAWLAGAGYDDADLEAIYEQLQRDQEVLGGSDSGEGSVEDADEVPDSAPAITRRGDVWLLGPHRIMCGDSTVVADVERVVNGERVELLIADPPYFEKVDADWDHDFKGFEGFLDFLSDVFQIHEPLLAERGTSGWFCAPDYAWHVEGRLRRHFAVFNHIVWFKGHGLGTTASIDDMRRWRPRTERLLLCERQHSPDALLASFNAKTAHIAARSAYSAQIDRLMAWRDEAKLSNGEIDKALGTNGMAGHYFGRSQWTLPTREAWAVLRPLFASRGVDIGEFDAQRREFDAQRREGAVDIADQMTDCWVMSPPAGEERLGHPSPKPVALLCKIVAAHSRDGDKLHDPFLGTGSSLVAAHLVGGGRRLSGMELDPHWVDVVCARWQGLTGIKPVLESTGDAHDFVDR